MKAFRMFLLEMIFMVFVPDDEDEEDDAAAAWISSNIRRVTPLCTWQAEQSSPQRWGVLVLVTGQYG